MDRTLDFLPAYMYVQVLYSHFQVWSSFQVQTDSSWSVLQLKFETALPLWHNNYLLGFDEDADTWCVIKCFHTPANRDEISFYDIP